MSDTETPPSYEELFPQRELASPLLESLASQRPPAALLERFSVAAPQDATYFTVEKDWAEGAGYYRGNQSLVCHLTDIQGLLSLLSLSNCQSLTPSCQVSWTGRGGGRGRAAWSGRGRLRTRRRWCTAGAGTGTPWRAREVCGGDTLVVSTVVSGPGDRCTAGQIPSLNNPLISSTTLCSGEVQFGSGSGKAGQTCEGHFR